MIIIALILLISSFHFTDVFWFLFPLAMTILFAIAYSRLGMDHQRFGFVAALYGVLSGILLYLVFAIGKSLIIWLKLPLLQELAFLYQTVSPSAWWHYVLLTVIIIPGEEFFWRGYIQKRLRSRFTPIQSILLSALLYSAIHLIGGNILLGIAALAGGISWGFLMHHTNSMRTVILSHLIFDFFLLVLFPLG